MDSVFENFMYKPKPKPNDEKLETYARVIDVWLYLKKEFQ
jgi:hypothetical protein